MKKTNFLLRVGAIFAIVICFCSAAFAQTLINSEDDLRAITAEGNYKLTADITLTSAWTPIAEFKGTLDGDGHVIFGLTMNTAWDSDQTALFKKTSGTATIKNLGFENASIVGGARTAVVVGLVSGGTTTIENCYVANSTISGRWCVASFVGKVDGGTLTIQNCYSSAYIYNPAISQNSGHTGGIIGHLNNASSKVENCYFSGIIQKELNSSTTPSEGQIAGIVAWNQSSNTINHNVNLAPYLLSNNGKYRISSIQSDNSETNGLPKGDNYSLASTVVSVYNGWENTSAVIATENAQYGLDKKHGLNIPDGDAKAKTQDFYETTLGWSFGESGPWKIIDGGSYPVFKWDALRPSIIALKTSFILSREESTIDLFASVFSGRGLGLTFTTESDKIEINGTQVSLKGEILQYEEVIVSVQEGILAPSLELTIALAPEYIAISTPEELELMRTANTSKYYLAKDLDMTGVAFTTIPEFKGTLDGQGHIIFGLAPASTQDGMGLFGKLLGDAIVKNVGFENAEIIGDARVGVVAGYMEGNATIENCYIANSTISGRWCVGSFVGRIRNVGDNAVIRNCYSSAYLLSPETTNNSGHIGGIVGNIFQTNKATVENCYFSGVIQKEPNETTPTEGQVAGIVGWIGKDDNQVITGYVIQNNVNLAPALLSNNGKHRISSTRSDEEVNDPVPGPNYSLSSTILSTLNDWENSSAIVTTGTSTNKDGENIPGGDANAKAQSFYETLGWEFGESALWKVIDGGSYPVFGWEAQAAHFVAPVKVVDLPTNNAPVDLSKYIFSGRGLDLSFSTESEKVLLSGSSICYKMSISEKDTVDVSVKEGAFTEVYTLRIALEPIIITDDKPANTEAVSIIAQGGEIQATFEGIARVKLYSSTGMLLDEATVNNMYTQNVRQGIYILSINGKTYKVAVK